MEHTLEELLINDGLSARGGGRRGLGFGLLIMIQATERQQRFLEDDGGSATDGEEAEE